MVGKFNKGPQKIAALLIHLTGQETIEEQAAFWKAVSEILSSKEFRVFQMQNNQRQLMGDLLDELDWSDPASVRDVVDVVRSHRTTLIDGKKSMENGVKNRPQCTDCDGTQPTFGPRDWAVRCKDHRRDGDVDTKDRPECMDPECTRRPSFGPPGTSYPLYCARHKNEWDIKIHAILCEQGCGTQATFGDPVLGKRRRCDRHRLAGDVAIGARKCEKCGKRPSLAPEGETIPLRCDKHRKDGDISVKPKCQWGETQCKITPCYGFPDGKAIMCAKHGQKIPGMFNVVSPRCEECGPTLKEIGRNPALKRVTLGTIAVFAEPGSSMGKRCSEHRKDDDVDVANDLCEYDNCTVYPSFGQPDGQRLHCKDHRIAGDVNLVLRECEVEGCTTLNPVFAPRGSPRGLRCGGHRISGDIDVVSRKCEDAKCEVRPVFGPRGTKKGLRCFFHSKKDDVNVLGKRCEMECCSPFDDVYSRPLTTLRDPVSKKPICAGSARVLVSMAETAEERARLMRHFNFTEELVIRQEQVFYNALSLKVPELQTLWRCLDTTVLKALAGKTKSAEDFRPDYLHVMPQTRMALHGEFDERSGHEDDQGRLEAIADAADCAGRTYVFRVNGKDGTAEALCTRRVRNGDVWYTLNHRGMGVVEEVAVYCREALEWMRLGLTPDEAEGRPAVRYF